jgi:hypothetical protein
MLVIGNTHNSLFHVDCGKKCGVLKSFFYNGENWYKLQEENSDKIFNSPSIFWDKIKSKRK